MKIDAASERSEQGRFLSQSPDSSNAMLGDTASRHSTRVPHPSNSQFLWSPAVTIQSTHWSRMAWDTAVRCVVPTTAHVFVSSSNETLGGLHEIMRKPSQPATRANDIAWHAGRATLPIARGADNRVLIARWCQPANGRELRRCGAAC